MGNYASIGDLQLYYEIHGNGYPLVLLHGGGSTIESSWGRILPELARKHQVIAVELQAHGHTLDIDRPLGFEQDADDVAALLEYLQILKADFMGFSNGGTTCLQIGIRHAGLVNKLILLAASFRRDGMPPGFFEGFEQVQLSHMPQPLAEAYLKANPDPAGLQRMFDRDVARMKSFKDIPDEKIRGISAPALVINGDAEVILAEHALALARTLPNAQLAILPGGHGDYIGEICTPHPDGPLPKLVVAVIESFLCILLLFLPFAGLHAQSRDSVRIAGVPRAMYWERPLKLGFLAQSPTGKSCRVTFSHIHYTTKKISDPYLGE